MRSMVFGYGTPEWRLADVVLSRLSLRYNLPVFATAGATDAKTINAQAGAEWAYSLLVCAMAGANLIHDVGYMESGLTGSLEALVLCDEIIGLVKSFTAGFEISQETLALDLIDRVGPAGHFMDTDHTLEHFRSAVWYPTLFDRARSESPKSKGDDLLDRTRQRVKELISE